MQYNPTILNTKYKTPHGVFFDSTSSKMGIDSKLKRERKLPGPLDY